MGNILYFSNYVGSRSRTYKSKAGDEAVVNYNNLTGNLFLTLKTVDGESYAIEWCHGGHVWKHFNVTFLGENMSEPGTDIEFMNKKKLKTVDIRASDDGSIVTITVMIYYTEQFAAITADIPGFVEDVIDETNQGYINSDIPLRIRLHCIEKANIIESISSDTLKGVC